MYNFIKINIKIKKNNKIFMYKDLDENKVPDASLDLDGALLNENFGIDVSGDVDISDVITPLT